MKVIAPQWANWKAQNVDGSWYYFEHKPERIENGWMECEDCKMLFSHRARPNGQWNTTLQEVTDEDRAPEKVHRLFG